jgi:hypothetical protein
MRTSDLNGKRLLPGVNVEHLLEGGIQVHHYAFASNAVRLVVNASTSFR